MAAPGYSFATDIRDIYPRIPRSNYPLLLEYRLHMCFTDTLGLCLSILGIYELLLYLSFHVISSHFSLDSGSSTNQFTRMRMESNHAPMISQQLRLTIQGGLAYRLYSLYGQIKAIKSKLQLAVDERQLAIMGGTSNTAVPSLAVATATFVNNSDVV
ncbi:hypothetical protein BC826DRAFT_1102866 [Russula brevipes]|nr:hypothetical protein BC826DRAFT_1102866 [Russula brevipes]